MAQSPNSKGSSMIRQNMERKDITGKQSFMKTISDFNQYSSLLHAVPKERENKIQKSPFSDIMIAEGSDPKMQRDRAIKSIIATIDAASDKAAK